MLDLGHPQEILKFLDHFSRQCLRKCELSKAAVHWGAAGAGAGAAFVGRQHGVEHVHQMAILT